MGAHLSILAVAVAVAAWYFVSLSPPKASSVMFLVFNYLARPNVYFNENYQFPPIELPSAWNGSYMNKNPHIWIYELSKNDLVSVKAAVNHFQKLNKTMEAMTVADFPLPAEFLVRIDDWRHQLSGKGRGFQVIRGVPVQQWSMAQSEIFFFALGKYLGIPGAQDVEGSLLGHVMDVGETNKAERPYRKRIDIAFHCDGADVVGLLCMHSAKKGGASRIVSSVRVFNELLKYPKGQQYAHRLFGKVLLATRKMFGLSSFLPVYPLRMDATGVLRSYWNQEFYLKSYRDPSTGELTERGLADPFVVEAVEAYDRILNTDVARGKAEAACHGVHEDAEEETGEACRVSNAEREGELGLSMYLQQGDIQLVSNHFVLHARTEFDDHTPEEIADADPGNGLLPPLGKRELLRLWLSHSVSEMDWPTYISKQVDLLKVAAAVVEGFVKYR